MITNENYQVSQGSALTIQSTMVDQYGNALTTLTGAETLSAIIWPGGQQPTTDTITASYANYALALFSLPLTAAQTAALAAGRYQILLRYRTGMADPLDGWGATLDILQGPGTETPPTTYCQFSDLLRYGRSWLRQLQTNDDEAGFAEQLGRGRSWIEDLGHAHYRVAAMTMVVGSQACGPRRSGARSTWLEDMFAADYLLITDQIKECCAKKTLAYICDAQVGVGERSDQYARLARMYHAQADYLGTCLTLSLDTNGDGFPDVNIDCSCTDPMYS